MPSIQILQQSINLKAARCIPMLKSNIIILTLKPVRLRTISRHGEINEQWNEPYPRWDPLRYCLLCIVPHDNGPNNMDISANTIHLGESEEDSKANENERDCYETLICEKIVATKSDIVKLRLMIMVIVFELLICISLILSLFGTQISIAAKIGIETENKCIPLATR